MFFLVFLSFLLPFIKANQAWKGPLGIQAVYKCLYKREDTDCVQPILKWKMKFKDPFTPSELWALQLFCIEKGLVETFKIVAASSPKKTFKPFDFLGQFNENHMIYKALKHKQFQFIRSVWPDKNLEDVKNLKFHARLESSDYDFINLLDQSQDVFDFVNISIAYGKNVNALGGLPLLTAARSNNAKVLELLLKNGASLFPLVPNQKYSIPVKLLQDSTIESPEVFDIIFKYGGATLQDIPVASLLSSAVSFAHPKIVDYFLKRHNNVLTSDPNMISGAIKARMKSNNQMQVLKLLSSSGFNFTALEPNDDIYKAALDNDKNSARGWDSSLSLYLMDHGLAPLSRK